jgi:hypothetical protein
MSRQEIYDTGLAHSQLSGECQIRRSAARNPNCHHPVTTGQGTRRWGPHDKSQTKTRRAPRARPPSIRALAPGAWDRASQARAKALAGGRRLALDMVRRKQARERAELAAQQAAFERAEAFVAQLQAELALAAWRHAEMAAIIAELAA